MSTPRIPSRFRWMAAAFSFLLLFGAGVLSWGRLATALGTRLAQEAASRLGVELTEGSFRVSLLDGLVLEGGRALARTEGRLYRFELPRVVFEPVPRALLSGVLEVRAIRFERPRIELVEDEESSQGPAPREADAREGFLDLHFGVDEVFLDDASVHFGDGDGISSTLEGVEIRLGEIGLAGSGRGLLALEGSGSFHAQSARLGELAVTDGRADLYLHEGRLSLTLLKFRTDRAPFVAEMRVDLERAPFGYDLSALGEPFDAAPLVGAPPGSLGASSLLVEVFGRGPAPSGFRAQGSVSLPEGAMGEVPLFEALNRALARDLFRPEDGRPETLIVYRVRDGYVLFEPFELVSSEAGVAIRGRAYLDGRLELEVEVSAPGVSAKTLSVTGTVEEPIARPFP